MDWASSLAFITRGLSSATLWSLRENRTKHFFVLSLFSPVSALCSGLMFVHRSIHIIHSGKRKSGWAWSLVDVEPEGMIKHAAVDWWLLRVQYETEVIFSTRLFSLLLEENYLGFIWVMCLLEGVYIKVFASESSEMHNISVIMMSSY